MSKKIYLFSLVLLALTFVSCEETKEEGRYDNWQARNEAFIDSLGNVYAANPNGELKRIELQTAPGNYIYYKKKVPVGEGKLQDKKPFYTSTITTYYKGAYIIGGLDSKGNFIGENFDGTFSGADPSVDFSRSIEFSVSSRVIGLSEVLQHMNIGERCEVYVPWEYGYGSSDATPTELSVTIPAYSTLVYDIQILTSKN